MVSRFTSWLFSLIFGGVVFGIIAATAIFYYFGTGLPDYKTLAKYEPPIVSRFYSSDGRLFAEYAYERRVYAPYNIIPDHVKNAFIAAEDKNFYSHFGIDIPSVFSAALRNLSYIGTSRRPAGASTITQQVARNFLLSEISSKVSYARKIKEAILSFRIERAFEKNYILELYLNEVYLGNRSYGIAAAALNYFNKPLNELTIAEAAYLAALPKAPSRYDPERARKLTYARRNWVIDRMYENEFITAQEAEQAKREEIAFHQRDIIQAVEGSYFAEEVRREVIKNFGDRAVYQHGYHVRTTLDPKLQELAEKSLQKGLENYDRRHGWRGPVAHIDLVLDSKDAGDAKDTLIKDAIKKIEKPKGGGHWSLAFVLEVTPSHAVVGYLKNEYSKNKVKVNYGCIPLRELKWARRFINAEERGPAVSSSHQVLKVGDLVFVEPILLQGRDDQSLKISDQKDVFEYYQGKISMRLCQVPEVSGALVAMDPHTGRVLAMQGGYSFYQSQFNRATQALRQTGSVFKPFVYLSALEAGLTPVSMLEDTPLAIDIGYGQGIWKPKNWNETFMGDITLRRSFELSRNVAAIRMVHESVGIRRVADVAKRFNIDKDMPPQLSGVLGACETTVLKLCAAYAMIANGGKQVIPTFLDHIQDRRGKTVLVNNSFHCAGCKEPNPYQLPVLEDKRPQATDPIVAHQVTGLLRGTVERGLSRFLLELPHEIAAKSGTTNGYYDTWMAGFSPTLTVVVFVGFDNPRTLGFKHYGSSVAGPIFKDFMEKALKDQPRTPFKTPQGAVLVRTNALTGRRADPGDQHAIYEAFKPGTPLPLRKGEERDENEKPSISDIDPSLLSKGADFEPHLVNPAEKPLVSQRAQPNQAAPPGPDTTLVEKDKVSQENSVDLHGTGGIY